MSSIEHTKREKTPFVPGPLTCARDFVLSDSSSGQPVMNEATLDFFRPITIEVVTSDPQGSEDPTQDGVAKETVRAVRTSGCVQPGDSEKLQILSEGERARDAALLHTMPDFNVPLDTIIRVDGMRYRIMKKKDHRQNGFVRYELLEDYEPAAPNS